MNVVIVMSYKIFGDGKYSILYEMDQDSKKVYYRNNEMYLKPRDFIENRSSYIIDTAKHPENIKF